MCIAKLSNPKIIFPSIHRFWDDGMRGAIESAAPQRRAGRLTKSCMQTFAPTPAKTRRVMHAIENASARPPHPKNLCMRVGCPVLLLVLVQDFCCWWSCPRCGSRFSASFLTSFLSSIFREILTKMRQKTIPGGPRRPPEPSQNAF